MRGGGGIPFLQCSAPHPIQKSMFIHKRTGFLEFGTRSLQDCTSYTYTHCSPIKKPNMVCWQHCRNPGANLCIIILTHAEVFLCQDRHPDSQPVLHQTICVTDCTQVRGARQHTVAWKLLTTGNVKTAAFWCVTPCRWASSSIGRVGVIRQKNRTCSSSWQNLACPKFGVVDSCLLLIYHLLLTDLSVNFMAVWTDVYVRRYGVSRVTWLKMSKSRGFWITGL